MLLNYFRIAVRNIRKHRVFSLINIAGLVISLTAFWVIALYVADEFSFDRYHKNASRIVRLVSSGKMNTAAMDVTGTSGKLAEALQQAFPQIESVVRINVEGGGVIQYGQQKLKENSILFADKSFFNVFTYHFIAGNAATALEKPQSIVITSSLAKRIFGDVNIALNKTIYFDGNEPNEITGVIEDVPTNSHFSFQGIRVIPANFSTDWQNLSLYTYLLLKNERDVPGFASAIDPFISSQVTKNMDNTDYRVRVQPLTAIHLHSHVGYELGNNGDLQFIDILLIAALLIVLIAVVNYVNITTARASVRVREIAIRKVIGSGRRSIIGLFLAESTTVMLISVALSILVVSLCLPFFNTITGKILPLWRFGYVPTIMILLLFCAFTGTLGGLYPALFLSRLNTIASLKGQMGKHRNQAIFRKSLVVFQFAITLVMIVFSVVIYRQLNYVSNKDLGFDKNELLTIHLNNHSLRQQLPILREALLANQRVIAVAAAGNPIGNNDIGMGEYNAEVNGVITRHSNLANFLQIDENFVPALAVKIIAGRNFDPAITTDSTASLLVNEALAKKEGWANPVGKHIQRGVDAAGKPTMMTIIGVVKDFSIFSLQHKIEPMILQLPVNPMEKDNMYLRIAKADMAGTLQFIEKTIQQFDHENLFEYHFIDQNFAAQYAAEQKQGDVLLLFTLLTISVACLGLLGLISFTAEQRVKEIGVRKVLGASVANIIALLSGDLLRLVAISMVFGIPLALILANKWLDNFAYRVQISWWIFAASGGLAFLIAAGTLALQGWKAASVNPVKSLKTT